MHSLNKWNESTGRGADTIRGNSIENQESKTIDGPLSTVDPSKYNVCIISG